MQGAELKLQKFKAQQNPEPSGVVFGQAAQSMEHAVMVQTVHSIIAPPLLHSSVLKRDGAALPLLSAAVQQCQASHHSRQLDKTAATALQSRILRMSGSQVWQHATGGQRQAYANGCVLAAHLPPRCSEVLAELHDERIDGRGSTVKPQVWSFAAQLRNLAECGWEPDNQVMLAVAAGSCALAELTRSEDDTAASIATVMACRMLPANDLTSMTRSKVSSLKERVMHMRQSGVWQQLDNSDRSLFILGTLTAITSSQSTLQLSIDTRDEHSPLHMAEDWSPTAGVETERQSSAFSGWGLVREAVLGGGSPIADTRSSTACSAQSGEAVVRGASPCVFEGPPCFASVAMQVVVAQRLKSRPMLVKSVPMSPKQPLL